MVRVQAWRDPSKMFLFMGKMALLTLRIGSNCVRGQWCFLKLLLKVAAFQEQTPFPFRFPVTSNRTQMWHGVAIPPLFVLGLIELFKMFAVLKRAREGEMWERKGERERGKVKCVYGPLARPGTASDRYVNSSSTLDAHCENKVKQPDSKCLLFTLGCFLKLLNC